MRTSERGEVDLGGFAAQIYLSPPQKRNEPVIPKRSEESQTSTCKTKIVIPTRTYYLFYDICYLFF